MITSQRGHREDARHRHNREFYERLRARRPELAEAALERAVRDAEAVIRAPVTREWAAPEYPEARGAVAVAEAPAARLERATLETIVRRERPVLFVESDWVNEHDVTMIGDEARELVDRLAGSRDRISPLMPLIGRIDVTHFAGLDYVGTGWLVAPGIVVTNRHVASMIARHDGRSYRFNVGVGGKPIEVSLCTEHEYDDLAIDPGRVFAVDEVLYIEPDSGPNDIAFLHLARQPDGNAPQCIPIADADVVPDSPIVVVGYPARAPKSVIPDQQLMKDLYRDRFDVKRAAPGFTMPTEQGKGRHDCTTLGGNSGSVVLDLRSGKAVGLHFAGLYQESNYAVPASVLREYVRRNRWNPPVEVDTRRPDGAPSAERETEDGESHDGITPSEGAAIGAALSLTLTVGAPVAAPVPEPDESESRSAAVPATRRSPFAVAAGPTRRAGLPMAEAAARDFWDQRPDGVVAVRVGFGEEDDEISDVPVIAASVLPDRLQEVRATAPTRFQTLDVRYYPANATEQIAAWPSLESVNEISYDDDARRGAGFSLAPVEERMTVLAHVGPEYSWDVLRQFLAEGKAKGTLVSAMYEFHARHIADAIEARLAGGASLRLVMDNASFAAVQDEDGEFERVERFEAWERFGKHFDRIVAPEGYDGLVSDSYHIKVTVRDDDTFWLSSGNWKAASSQPIITQAQRDLATITDLPGNREWHVVIRSRTLADRLRNHITQDFKRSAELGGGPLPKSREAVAEYVDVPIEEGVLEERRPPGVVVAPETFDATFKVLPLLTPDSKGAVYSEAVLELIKSAKKSLLFQIPYIGMPANPREDRGYIDELIRALTRKLKTLDDARVILRVGGSRLSAPTHAAWYFKSKGVDIGSRLRQLPDTHTKGMIVDGKRVLIGSHNWSKPGVTLNRDASLIFENPDIAGYFARAFEIDWARATAIRPKRYAKTEAVVMEAVGDAPPPGYRRVPLADLLKEDE